MTRGRRPARWAACALLLLGLCLSGPEAAAQSGDSPWSRIDYSELVDRRQPSHSGDPVGALLSRLGGRPLPGPGQRPRDRADHKLLDPLLEPYAFVLSDALDSGKTLRGRPWVEIGSLWRPGTPQPAWVELLRSRRYVVESDGHGSLRLLLPLSPDDPALDEGAEAAAQAAYDRAWSVIRHVLAAERLRLQSDGDEAPTLDVRVHAFVHEPARSQFRLGMRPARIRVEATAPAGLRPPLDLGALRGFLEAGLQLEGARLEPDGSIRWLGSRPERPASLLGRPLTAGDLAVAYRAVFHGGLAEPFMSLDRGYSPHRSVVSYGGRLRDTGLGMVSLLCDVRFKTFSQGIDIRSDRDMRETVRESLPGFRSHLEHLAYHPEASGTRSQQTRLWFYPDNVDLTVSPQGDLLALRRVRMSAASERFDADDAAAAGNVPPWTSDTVEAINRHYDELAALFPEMRDLDQVVRLLSVFTWLRVQSGRALIPDLDVLLAEELPARPTPRDFPQLLAFNALPEEGSDAPVEVLSRVDVVTALDRLESPSGAPLPAARRFERARGALNPGNPEQAPLAAELEQVNASRVADEALDWMTYRAERLLMHDRVLSTLPARRQQAIEKRFADGEQVRIFSVGIGGLDLSMDQAMARAGGGRLALGEGGFGFGGAGSLAPATATEGGAAPISDEPREAWQQDPVGLAVGSVPAHGLASDKLLPDSRTRHGADLVVVGPAGARAGRPAWVRTVHDELGPEARVRTLWLDGRGRVERIERYEDGRRLAYRIEGDTASVTVRLTAEEPEAEATPSTPGASVVRQSPLPAGLAQLSITPMPPVPPLSEAPRVTLRLEPPRRGANAALEAAFPRSLLQRLVLGRAVDLTPGQPLSGLAPLPGALGAVEAMLVLQDPEIARLPWERSGESEAGEESAGTVARALNAWWAEDPTLTHRAIVGVERATSPTRWSEAPRPDTAHLWVASDALPPPFDDLGPALVSHPSMERVEEDPAASSSSMVLMVSAESPDRIAEKAQALAADPRMQGKLLGIWSLQGALRQDLPSALLEAGQLAGVGIAAVPAAGVVDDLDRVAESLGSGARIEARPGSLLWYF